MGDVLIRRCMEHNLGLISLHCPPEALGIKDIAKDHLIPFTVKNL